MIKAIDTVKATLYEEEERSYDLEMGMFDDMFDDMFERMCENCKEYDKDDCESSDEDNWGTSDEEEGWQAKWKVKR